MVQLPQSIKNSQPTDIRHPTSPEPPAKKKPVTPRKYIPARPAPPPPQKSLQSRTTATVSPKQHINPPQITSELAKLASSEVKSLTSHIPEIQSFNKKYIALAIIRQQYAPNHTKTTECSTLLASNHSHLSSQEVALLQQAICKQLTQAIKILTQHTVQSASKKTSSEVHYAQNSTLSSIKESISQRNTGQLQQQKLQFKQQLASDTHTPATPEDNIYKPSLSNTEDMLVKEATQKTIKQCFDTTDSAVTPKQKLAILQDAKALYQTTAEGLDEEAEADIQTSLTQVAKKHNISIANLPRFSGIVAHQALSQIEQALARLTWQMTGETSPGREGEVFSRTLKNCTTPESLQQATSLWTETYHNLSPPEEKILRQHFQRVMSYTFCQTMMLDQITEKALRQRTATLARLIVQMEEDPPMTMQILRSHCKSYPILLEMMGFPTYTQGQQLQEALTPLMKATYAGVNKQAHQTMVTQMAELFSNKRPASGTEKEVATQMINLKKQQQIHKKDLMANAKNKLDRDSPEEKTNRLKQIEKRVGNRATCLESLVHTVAEKALRQLH